MSLIKYEINLMLTWSASYVITNSTGVGTFAITDTKLYIPLVTLSTQDNMKPLKHLKSGFNEQLIGVSINQKYQHKIKIKESRDILFFHLKIMRVGQNTQTFFSQK